VSKRVLAVGLLLPLLHLAAAIPARAAGVFTSGATFTRVTSGDIVTLPALYWGGSWGDYDDDGWLDLFVGASQPFARNFLYHNERDGTFSLIDDAAMPKVPSNQHGASWGDYDNDGHLDLIVTAGNPGEWHNMLYRNQGNGTFAWTTDNPIYTETRDGGFHGPVWLDYDNDGFLDLFVGGHDMQNRLFRNDGHGSFTRITDRVLVNDATTGVSFGVWTDYDGDGDLDLIVSNVAAPGSSLFTTIPYRNDGGGVFTRVTDSGLSGRLENTYASCTADYDNDGFLDLFLANAQQNSLYHNGGDGTFTRVTGSTTVKDTIPASAIFSACAWGDYDNDGFLDLYVAVADLSFPLPPRVHGFLYHNGGDGTFTKVTAGAIATDPSTGASGASWGDYDNDGFLDLFVSQGGFSPRAVPNLLYHNDGNGNAWLNVKLVGTVSNRSAIGAKVRVNAFFRGESRWQLREISGGDSESNQQSLNAEFGLADATMIDTVRVEWPSGIVQELHHVAPRQFLTITEARPCDVDGTGLIDRNDVQAIVDGIGATATPGDPRDADGDGHVTIFDSAACANRCTFPNCAACGLLGIEPVLVLIGLHALRPIRRRRPSLD